MALRRGAICLLRHLQEADGDSFDVAPSVRHVEAVAIYEQRWRLEQNGDLTLCFSFQTPSSFIGRLRGMRHHASFPDGYRARGTGTQVLKGHPAKRSANRKPRLGPPRPRQCGYETGEGRGEVDIYEEPHSMAAGMRIMAEL